MSRLVYLQEAAAAKRLNAESKKQMAKIAWEKSSLRHRDRLHMELLHNAFKRSEGQLTWALEKRKAGWGPKHFRGDLHQGRIEIFRCAPFRVISKHTCQASFLDASTRLFS